MGSRIQKIISIKEATINVKTIKCIIKSQLIFLTSSSSIILLFLIFLLYPITNSTVCTPILLSACLHFYHYLLNIFYFFPIALTKLIFFHSFSSIYYLFPDTLLIKKINNHPNNYLQPFQISALPMLLRHIS